MFKPLRCLVIAASALSLSSFVLGQQLKSQPAPAAPVPRQVSSAKKFFISNAGSDRLETLGEAAFDGGPDRPYNELYVEMSAAHYELATSASDADLVLEIGWRMSNIELKLPTGSPMGQLQLAIIDPKTHVRLWEIREYVQGAILLGNRDKNFDRAMNTVVTRLKALEAG